MVPHYAEKRQPLEQPMSVLLYILLYKYIYIFVICIQYILFGHAEKSFLVLVKWNQNRIVFTIFRLIWNSKRNYFMFKINWKRVNTIWFRLIKEESCKVSLRAWTLGGIMPRHFGTLWSLFEDMISKLNTSVLTNVNVILHNTLPE